MIVPPTGGVEVRFTTNLEVLEKGLPEELLQMLGPPETLRQGKWHVGDYFQYRGAWIPGGSAITAAAKQKAELLLAFPLATPSKTDAAAPSSAKPA